MKVFNLSSLGILTFALAGCIGNNHTHDDDHKSSSSLSSVSIVSSSVNSSAVSSSSMSISSSVTSEASSSILLSSSSLSVGSSSEAFSSMTVPVSSAMASSSSSLIMPVSSSSSVMSSVSSKTSSSMSSSSMSSETSSSLSSVASSSSAMVNIEELQFTETLNTDQTIKADSINNLALALSGLIDQQAYTTFYLSLVAQGLDQEVVAKAVSVLGPIGNAIAADFINAISGQALLPAPEGINLVTRITPVGSSGAEFDYTVTQTINEVDVNLKMALRFEENAPTFGPLIGGRKGYNVFLNGLKLVVNEMSLTTSDVSLTLDTTIPTIATSGLLKAQVELTPDGSSIVGVTFNGESLLLNLKGMVINGMIGVKANMGGTIAKLNATLDLESGASTINLTQPDVSIDMQGVDTSN